MVFLLLLMFGITGSITIVTNNDLLADDQRHLVTSLKTIMLRHFTPEGPLMISLPKSSEDAKHAKSGSILAGIYDVILKTIHEESQWRLHTTKPDVDTLETSPKTQVFCVAYIIITSGPAANNVTSNLYYQLRDLERKNSLNNRAAFFVVVTDSFESPKQLAAEVIENFWEEYNILDVLVMIPVTSRDLKSAGTSTFNFYTWFPFHSSGNEIVLIDEFHVDTEVKSVRSSNLFPNKIPKKFQNHKILSVMTDEFLPVTFLVKNGTEGSTGENPEYKGVEIDLFKLTLERLNLSYEYKVPDSPSSYELLALLLTGDLDMMFSSTPLGLTATSWGDPSISYYETGYKWYVPCPAPIPRLDKISGIFSPSVWVMLIVSFVVVTTVMWQLAKRSYETEIRDYRTVSICAYNAWATAMGVSAPQPSTTGMRTFFFLWVCYCYIISLLFQTFFTSFLVDPGVGKQIENVEEIVSSGLEYGYNIGLYDVFFESSSESVGDERYLDPINCNYTETCLLRVMNDRDFATLQVEFIVKYFSTLYLPKEGLLCNIPDNFRVFDIVMYFPKGSHFRFPINGVIRRILESGLFQKMEGDMTELWKIQKESKAVEDYVIKDDSVDDYFVFNTSHLQVAFWLLALGLGLSFVCLLFEILCHRLRVVT